MLTLSLHRSLLLPASLMFFFSVSPSSYPPDHSGVCPFHILWPRSPADVKDLTNHAVKNEPGTLVYVPAQDPEDPNKVTIWEEVSARPMAVIDFACAIGGRSGHLRQYASEDAFNAHCALPPFVGELHCDVGERSN